MKTKEQKGTLASYFNYLILISLQPDVADLIFIHLKLFKIRQK